MTKKTKQLGLDGNQAGEEEEEESESSEETAEGDEPKPTDEEVAATKKKEKEEAELRKTIEAEYAAKIAKEAADKALAEADEKEKVPEAVKGYADVLRKQLGDAYPPAYNDLKIRPRTIAMLGLIEMKGKLAASVTTKKGASIIPKPTPKESTKKRGKFNKTTSYKEKAKDFPWKQEY